MMLMHVGQIEKYIFEPRAIEINPFRYFSEKSAVLKMFEVETCP